MSYDIWLSGDTSDDRVEEVGNYTSNCAGMWQDALGFPLRDLNGKNAGESVSFLEAAVTKMALNPQRYRDMEPTNGWGDYEGALNYLQKLMCACRQCPNATIDMWF